MENQKPKFNSQVGLKTSLTIWYHFKLIPFVKRQFANRERIIVNLFIIVAFSSVLIGLIILGRFLYKLSNSYSINGTNILLQETGQVGDFIGGVIGTIWSLTGVLLFYVTLQLQRKELAENRKHFQLSRITEIIYKQLEMYNRDIKEIKILNLDDDNKPVKHKGKKAILLIIQQIESMSEVVFDKTLTDEEKATNGVKYMSKNIAFIEFNKKELQKLYNNLGNHVDVLRAILIKEDMPPEDLNELKAIFFRNIGREFLNASEIIHNNLESYKTLKEKHGQKENIFLSELHDIQRKIEVIDEFRKVKYTKKMIVDYVRSRDIYNMTSF
jgi:hypothetical protein